MGQNAFLYQIFYYNTVKEWLIALSVVATHLIILMGARRLALWRLKKGLEKSDKHLDHQIVNFIEKIHKFFIIFLAIYAGSLMLTLPTRVHDIIEKLLVAAFLGQGGIWGFDLLNFWIERYKIKQIEKDESSTTTVMAMGVVLRIVLWSILILLALDNLGINITTLVAGLGITGIAVALAIQNILSDLFASLSIILDKPFVIGDYIMIDEHEGNIEHIGLKTTRIRRLSGEQLIFSNSDMLSSRIRNFKRMQNRRVILIVGVVYQTPTEKLKAIPKIAKDVIENQEKAFFDRAHFKAYGDYALKYEIIYWVKGRGYRLYMDVQHNVNIKIHQRFREENIQFAYPTQLVYMDQSAPSNDNPEKI